MWCFQRCETKVLKVYKDGSHCPKFPANFSTFPLYPKASNHVHLPKTHHSNSTSTANSHKLGISCNLFVQVFRTATAHNDSPYGFSITSSLCVCVCVTVLAVHTMRNVISSSIYFFVFQWVILASCSCSGHILGLLTVCNYHPPALITAGTLQFSMMLQPVHSEWAWRKGQLQLRFIPLPCLNIKLKNVRCSKGKLTIVSYFQRQWLGERMD